MPPRLPHHPHPSCGADVLVSLGSPNTAAGHYHVALVSPQGDIRIEHASRELLSVPASRADLTEAALAVVLELMEAPPVCCNLPRPSRLLTSAAAATRQAAPYPRAVRPRLRRASSQPCSPPWKFPTFPTSLPAGVYRPPPLSAVLQQTPGTEKQLLLGAADRPLVPPARHPAPTTCILPPHIRSRARTSTSLYPSCSPEDKGETLAVLETSCPPAPNAAPAAELGGGHQHPGIRVLLRLYGVFGSGVPAAARGGSALALLPDRPLYPRVGRAHANAIDLS